MRATIAHVKAQVNRHSPNKYVFYEKINVILCSADKKDLSAFWFFNKQWENYKPNQYVHSLPVHLLLAQPLPRDTGTAAVFSPLHFVFRTDTWELEDWNSKTSKLPLCVGIIFHWHQNVTSTFIIWLDNKPPSRGLLLSGSSLYPLWQTTIQQLGKIWLFYRYISFFFQGFCTDDNSQEYTCKLKKNPT